MSEYLTKNMFGVAGIDRSFRAAEPSDISDAESRMDSVVDKAKKAIDKKIAAVDAKCDSLATSLAATQKTLTVTEKSLVALGERHGKLSTALASGGPLEEIFSRVATAHLASIDARTRDLCSLLEGIEYSHAKGIDAIQQIVGDANQRNEQAAESLAALSQAAKQSAEAAERSLAAADSLTHSVRSVANDTKQELELVAAELSRALASQRAASDALGASLAAMCEEANQCEAKWVRFSESSQKAASNCIVTMQGLLAEAHTTSKEFKTLIEAAAKAQNELQREACRFRDFETTGGGSSFVARFRWLFCGSTTRG
jgi:hypothetical protein